MSLLDEWLKSAGISLPKRDDRTAAELEEERLAAEKLEAEIFRSEVPDLYGREMQMEIERQNYEALDRRIAYETALQEGGASYAPGSVVPTNVDLNISKEE